MGRPVFLVENVFNTRIFSGHTLTANEEATGHEVEFVATGRRRVALNYWAPTTANAEASVTCTFDAVRGWDMIALDRGHNLAGETVRIRTSSDSFTTYTEDAVTIPSEASDFQRLDLSPGVLTPEGAWLYRPGLRSGSAVRFVIDAMGAGLTPKIVGLYVGLSFRPLHARVLPFDHGRLSVAERQGVVRDPVTGEIELRLADGTEERQAQRHFRGLFWRHRPMWIVHDDESAEHAVLTQATAGDQGFARTRDWTWMSGPLGYREIEPDLSA